MTGAGAVAGVGRPLRDSDPTELGPYRLLRRLGEGGMGSVYLAQSAHVHVQERLVALKVIRPDLAGDPDFRRRFRSEVNRAKQVPAFCTAEVLDADPDHDPPYLVVEFVNGPSLARVVADRGPLTPANLHGLAVGVATALAAIHGAGVIHRDLKPANVLLALGSPKVIDFGIARAAEGTVLTETGNNQLIGTIAYMAPERLDPSGGKPLTPAADIFAWGAVVAFAGTGRTPFGSGSVEAAARILTQPPDLTGLTGDLRDLVARALAKDPAARPTARELLDHLVVGGPRRTQQGLIEAGSQQAVVTVPNQPVSTSDTTKLVAPPPSPPRGRGRAVVTLMAVAILALTATVVGILTGVIKPIVVGASEHSPTPPVTPSATPSATASPSPSPSPSASPSPTLSPDRKRIVLAKDTLAAPGAIWYDKDETATVQGKCIVNKGMKVTRTVIGTYRCPTLPDPVTDSVTYVDATLLTEGTCAAVWFRFTNVRGYLLTACQDRYQLWEHDGNRQDVVRTKVLPTAMALNSKFQITVLVEGKTIRIFHNGAELMSVDSQTYTTGRVVFGIWVPKEAPPLPTYEVLFANAEIYELR